jgi:hypothetical protein
MWCLTIRKFSMWLVYGYLSIRKSIALWSLDCPKFIVWTWSGWNNARFMYYLTFVNHFPMDSNILIASINDNNNIDLYWWWYFKSSRWQKKRVHRYGICQYARCSSYSCLVSNWNTRRIHCSFDKALVICLKLIFIVRLLTTIINRRTSSSFIATRSRMISCNYSLLTYTFYNDTYPDVILQYLINHSHYVDSEF